jgi:hypothetical protein
MASYSPNVNLYLPSRNDADVDVDTSLTDNFNKIDTSLAQIATIPKGNDRAKLQEAINSATGILHLPPGDFVLEGTGTELLLINKPLKIKGSGHNTKLIIKSTVAATTDVIRVSPLVGVTGKTLYSIEDLQIIPESGTPARHGIHLDVTNAGQYLSKFTLKNVIVQQLGGKAFKLTNPTNLDGFFTSTIQNNLLYGGMEFQRNGDSVMISENTITGSNTGIYMTGIQGACQVVIEKNNITSDGGAIFIDSADQVKIRNNQIEQVNPYTGTLSASVYLGLVYNADIDSNNITAHGNVAHNIRLNQAYRTKISKNTMRQGTAEMIRIDTNSNKTDIAYDNYYINNVVPEAEIAPSILDNGVGTMGVEKTLTLQNSWGAYDSANMGAPRCLKKSNGEVKLVGSVSGGTNTAGTIFTTLPIGFRPSKVLRVNAGVFITGGTMGLSTVIIDTTGTLMIETIPASVTRIDLTGISFPTLY